MPGSRNGTGRDTKLDATHTHIMAKLAHSFTRTPACDTELQRS